MNFHRRKREKVDITLISMIDVLFVLLLFFMVSTNFKKNSGLNIHLPQIQQNPTVATVQFISLLVGATGNYQLIDQKGVATALSDESALRMALTELAQKNIPATLLINADANAPYQAVISVLDYAQQAGLSDIVFAAQTKKP